MLYILTLSLIDWVDVDDESKTKKKKKKKKNKEKDDGFLIITGVKYSSRQSSTETSANQSEQIKLNKKKR